ncbi:MAG: aminoacyl-tRNA hydrolase [Gammaproteobacteria bacterium]|nr:aminoacyl-tRNA hydrolase [Gammaproteobacteria bacterium]
MGLNVISGDLVGGIGWRIRRAVGDKRIDDLMIRLAERKRPLLGNTTFLAVVGSGGKTTAKDLLYGVLQETGTGSRSLASLNAFPEVAKMVLRTRRADRFCVVELSEDSPGSLERASRLVRPRVAVLTVIRDDHLAAFSSKDELLDEFKAFLADLPADGTAVLNADDASFGAFASVSNAPVLSYGTTADADIRATDVCADWPQRLAFTVHSGEQSARVETRLVGEHWVHAVLAAIAGGVAYGMPLDQAARGVGRIEAYEGRMQPVDNASGVDYVRDDFKAPMWTLPSCLALLENASTKGRKIVVLGTLSDRGAGAGSTKKYRDIAAKLVSLTDIAIFVGPMAHSALATKKAFPQKTVRTFSNIEDAAGFFQAEITPGDLVLFKGTNKQDHLSRIFLAQTGTVACWRNTCGIEHFCGDCGYLGQPVSERFQLDNGVIEEAGRWLDGWQRNHGTLDEHQLIVGLGNPAGEYGGTPHNAGFEAVSLLAERQRLHWHAMPLGELAEGTLKGNKILLFKPGFNINNAGPVLGALASLADIALSSCILVHDELELRYGDIKVRRKGGDGGHRGLATLLDLLQNDAVWRLKIGVRSTTRPADLAKYVLSKVEDGERENHQAGLCRAADQLEQMV